jgi:hypothetical protein
VLDQIQVAEFGGMIYVDLDPAAAPLPEHAVRHFHGLVLDAYRHGLARE